MCHIITEDEYNWNMAKIYQLLRCDMSEDDEVEVDELVKACNEREEFFKNECDDECLEKNDN
jgi:hypothetical protein